MTATETEAAGFVQDICAKPADDTPRLVYADWLQEHGEEARAEFIRVQVALAADEAELGQLRAAGEPHVEVQRRVILARRRERELLGPHSPGQYGENHWVWFAEGLNWARSRTLVRGFVSEVTCTAADWLAHADAIAWGPTQTVECPEKRDPKLDADASVRVGTAIEYRPHRSCETCSGTGLAPRACPPTALPLTKVTTTNRFSTQHIEVGPPREEYTRRCRFRGRQWHEVKHLTNPTVARERIIHELLKAEWPGIEFVQPPFSEPVNGWNWNPPTVADLQNFPDATDDQPDVTLHLGPPLP